MTKQIATPTIPLAGGWSVAQIRSALQAAGLEPATIAQANGLEPATVRAAIRGERRGLLGRLAVADALGVPVTEIWPDARLRPKFRRAS